MTRSGILDIHSKIASSCNNEGPLCDEMQKEADMNILMREGGSKGVEKNEAFWDRGVYHRLVLCTGWLGFPVSLALPGRGRLIISPGEVGPF